MQTDLIARARAFFKGWTQPQQQPIKKSPPPSPTTSSFTGSNFASRLRNVLVGVQAAGVGVIARYKAYQEREAIEVRQKCAAYKEQSEHALSLDRENAKPLIIAEKCLKAIEMSPLHLRTGPAFSDYKPFPWKQVMDFACKDTELLLVAFSTSFERSPLVRWQYTKDGLLERLEKSLDASSPTPGLFKPSRGAQQTNIWKIVADFKEAIDKISGLIERGKMGLPGDPLSQNKQFQDIISELRAKQPLY
jgi:hypothetical protein